jgi:transcriptional regulator with XRE-family HTH domain
MSTQEGLALRRKIMGVFLRNAREQAGKSKKECAEALGSPSSFINRVEQGERDVSLPQLEILAVLFRIPIDYFWSDNLSAPTVPQPLSPAAIPLRRRIIGTLLRKARLDAGKTLKECALFLGYSPARISAYEYGQRDIPFLELHDLAGFIGVPIAYFLDEGLTPGSGLAEAPPSKIPTPPLARSGGDGAAIARGRAVDDEQLQQFRSLPGDIQEFVLNPANTLYLRVAMKLSTLSVGTLRQIAEDLLDITF